MNIRLITLGKIKPNYAKDGIQTYEKRLKAFCSFEIVTITPESISPTASKKEIEQALKLEAEHVLNRYSENIICLDPPGKSFTTKTFSNWLTKQHHSGTTQLNFVLGSAHGLSPYLKQKALLCLSLSQLTMQHDLAALVFIEQLYRAFTIEKGLPYHK